MQTITSNEGNTLEALENRIAPAGLVTVTLERGVLTVNGDDANNQLEILAGPNGQLLIVPSDDTDVGAGVGVSRTFTGPVKRIVSDLGDGSDDLLIRGFRTLTSIDISAGAGNDLIDLEHIGVSRGVEIDLGAGNDELDVTGANVRIGGNLAIQGGEGDNGIFLSALRAVVRGQLTVTGGSGNDTVELSPGDLQVLKNATLTLGGGNNTVTLDDNAHVQVRGSLSITTGNGVDDVGLEEGASLSVRRNLTFELGDGQNSISQHGSASLSVGGTLRATGGVDADSFDVGGENFTVRDAVLNPGDGRNVVALSGSAATLRNLTMTGGAGDDNISILNDNLTITGRLRLDGGNGANNILLVSENLLVKGSASFQGGNGIDNVSIFGDGRFSGAVLVDIGAGGAVLDPQIIHIEAWDSGFVFGKSLTARSTGGAESTDEFLLRNAEVRGKTNIQMGEGASSVGLDDVYFRNTVLVETNGGNDSIGFDASTFFPFDSLALKAVTIRPGQGNDQVQIGAGEAGRRVDFRARLSVIDEGGTDTINDVENANLFRPNIPPVITGFENPVT